MTLPTGTPLAYPDAELVLMDILESVWPGMVVTWLPENAPDGTIWIQRIGGGPDDSDITDYPTMRVATYGATRTAAWNLARDVERLITRYHGRRTPAGWQVDYARLAVGGVLDPDLNPDDRRVIKNYDLGFRRQLEPA